jgi:hypothetical protein
MIGLAPSQIVDQIVEFAATGLSCGGAYRVAQYGLAREALIGWAAWVAAGVLWIWFATSNAHWFMAVTQGYFFYTACVGLRNTRRSIVVKKGVEDDEFLRCDGAHPRG